MNKAQITYLVAVPAAPASVRKQWEYATYFNGNCVSARIASM